MNTDFSADFFKYTNQYNNNSLTSNQVNGVDNKNDNSSSKGVQNEKDNTLSKTSVFDAAKNGMQPKGKAQQGLLAQGLQADGGKNWYGGAEGGDTVNFSNTARDAYAGASAQNVNAETFSFGFSVADNSEEIQELADTLGCEATEEAIKAEFDAMSGDELAKLDSDIIDKASDLDIIDEQSVKDKLGYDKVEAQKSKVGGKDQMAQKPFGGFGQMANANANGFGQMSSGFGQMSAGNSFGKMSSAANFGMAMNGKSQNLDKSFMNAPNPEDMKKLKLSGFSMGAEV